MCHFCTARYVDEPHFYISRNCLRWAPYSTNSPWKKWDLPKFWLLLIHNRTLQATQTNRAMLWKHHTVCVNLDMSFFRLLLHGISNNYTSIITTADSFIIISMVDFDINVGSEFHPLRICGSLLIRASVFCGTLSEGFYPSFQRRHQYSITA